MHPISNPTLCHANFAQIHFYVETVAEYLRSLGGDEVIPFIVSGDLNSYPSSAVLSAYYGEDVEDETTSQWTIPVTLTDRTKIRGDSWGSLKKKVMESDYESSSWYICIDAMEKKMV